MRSARVAMLLGLVIVVANVLRAQKPCEACETGQPSENTVAAWLESGDPRLEAWGAAFALKRGDQALVPEMIGLARNWVPLPVQVWKAGVSSAPRTQDQLDRRAAMSDVLDALIGMHATLELDVLRKLARDFSSQTIVLVARMSPGEVQPLLMEWFELPDGPDEQAINAPLRRAAAAMLANHPATGFAAALMHGTHVRITIAVALPNDGVMGGGLSSCCGSEIGQLARADWPSVQSYWVRETTGKNDGAEVLVAGLDPIRVVTASQAPVTCPSRLFLDDRKRERLIAQMLGIAPNDLPWRPGRIPRILYSSDGQVAQEIRTIVNAEESALDATEKMFESRGLIPATDNGAALPQLDVWLWDQRTNRTAALPKPVLPYANLHWSDDNVSWNFEQNWN